MQEVSYGTQQEMNALQRIVNLFTSPATLFGHLASKPDWAAPLVILILLFAGTGVWLNDIIKAEQIELVKEQIRSSERVPDSQKDEQIEAQTGAMEKFWVVGYAAGGLFICVAYFSGALFLMLAAKVTSSGSVPYKAVLSVFGYSMLIDVLAGLIKAPLMYVNKTIFVHTGLGLLFAPDERSSVAYAFLSKFDLFTFWQLAILILGMSILYKMPKGKSAGIVVGLWLIWILITTGFTALGKMFT